MPKKRARVLSILGSSYSAIDAHQEELSFSHYMSEDYPDLMIKNFARSAHGVDYTRFVLDWMIYTGYRSDLILLEVPPPARLLFWEGEGNTLVSPDVASGYFDERCIDNTDNLFLCEPHDYVGAERLVFSTNYYRYGGKKTSNQMFSKKETPHIDFMHDRTIVSTQYHIFNSISFLNQLEWYEKQLKCKIFYYSHDISNMLGVEGTRINKSNFNNQTALEFMHENTNNFTWDSTHLNSYGSEYFYKNYLKASPFGEALENIL